ncbi:MAG: histidine kinase [Pseudomonadales bacterium]|nr:histidine kinase [Pseudomonadales bacterium]
MAAVISKTLDESRSELLPFFHARLLLLWVLQAAILWAMNSFHHQSSLSPLHLFLWILLCCTAGILLCNWLLRPVYGWLQRKNASHAIKAIGWLGICVLAFYLLFFLSQLILMQMNDQHAFLPKQSRYIILSFLSVFLLWSVNYHLSVWQNHDPSGRALRRELSEHVILYPCFQFLGWSMAASVWMTLIMTDDAANFDYLNFIIPWCISVSVASLLISHGLLRPFYQYLLNAKMSSWSKGVLSFFIIILCSCFVMGLVSPIVSAVLKIFTASPAEHAKSYLLANIAVQSPLFVVWSALYIGWMIWKKNQQVYIQNLQLEKNLRQAQLAALKQQLNPHFIFNALNSLRFMIVKNPETARNMVTELSNLLRYSLYHGAMDTVTLQQEIDSLKDYLAIELLRYENRLDLHWHIDKNLLNAAVMPLSLQCLVENAIKHAINDFSDGITIVISAHQNQGDLQLSVSNTGYLKPEAGKGIGLQNCRERLELLFGSGASLKLTQASQQNVVAEIIHPLREVQAPQSMSLETE